MSDLAEVLGPSLNAGPVPDSGPALVRYAGGRAALVRELTGMDRAPRRGEYPDAAAFDAARTKWRSAQRNAQRWDKGRRPTRKSLTPPVKGRLRRKANVERRRELAARGLRARLYARVRVSTPGFDRDDVRDRVMPASGPGQYLAPAVVEDVLTAIAEEGRDAAAEDFLEAFLDAYGFDADVEIESVKRLKVWAEGETEPA